MRVPATKPFFSNEDIEFITEKFKEILRGESFLTMHKYGAEFEEKFAQFIGTKYAVGCNSGTSALELICRALKISGKEVVLPSNTFVATANAIINAGGIPVFADCGDDMCLDPDDVVAKITSRTIAVMHVHIGGIVSESIFELQKICHEKNLHLIEDAAQAHGSALNGIKAGTFGIAAGFSFFSTKVMTTGEGGMVTTNDLKLVEKMKSLREFGKVKQGIYINYYTDFGYNWRLPEVASLMGIRQLESIEEFIVRRRQIAKIYDEEFYGNPNIVLVVPQDKENHNYFKYLIITPNHDRKVIHKYLESKGIQPSGYVYELPLHKQPVFPEANNLSLPKTEYVCEKHLALPIFYGMTDEQVRYVASTLKEIL
ncbi:MAG: DegT/DnrJ/EryC1/StrS family aminotransferase [Bacteroidia bacterium]|nr:DegT/DnrJ/EryC1/StrS family aminotransferase [Bacteroidia bacterium]